MVLNYNLQLVPNDQDKTYSITGNTALGSTINISHTTTPQMVDPETINSDHPVRDHPIAFQIKRANLSCKSGIYTLEALLKKT